MRRSGDAAVGVSPRCGRNYEQLQLDSPPTHDQNIKKLSLEQSIGLLYMYDGKFLEAASWLQKALESSRAPDVPAAVRERLTAVLGIVAMRRGEIENCLECVGPVELHLPDRPRGRSPAISRARARRSGGSPAYLEESPRDLRVIWLLNIAYMTLGEYPEKVPPQYLIPVELFRSEADVGRFDERRVARPA